jgi:hypothetical protein
MVATTIEKPVHNENPDVIRRLVEQPGKVRAGLFGKLAGSRLGRWAKRYAEYQLETRYRHYVSAVDNPN